MVPAIGQVCSLRSDFERDIEDYSSGKCQAVELWFTKLETYLESHSIDEVVQLLRRFDVSAPVASLQGGLLTSQGAERAAAWELFDRRLDLCRKLGTETIVVACDCPAPLSQQDVQRVLVSLQQAAERAGERQLRIALEFQAKSALGNNLRTAAALVDDIDSPHLGICLDAFHFFVGPSMSEDLGMLNQDNLYHVQLCDLADISRELASDSDRILPGEGDIPIKMIVDHLRAIQYVRHVSVELMNPRIWQISPRQFGEIAMTSLRRILGQASM